MPHRYLSAILRPVRTARTPPALRWLARHGADPADAGEVAHALTDAALTDPDLTDRERLELGLGLLEVLEHYWVTVELEWFLERAADPALYAVYWQAYREHLEQPVPTEAVLYTLWVELFPYPATGAWHEMLGRDVDLLATAAEGGALRRRARAVLADSGPVPWEVKLPVYQVAATVPELRGGLYRGLLHGYHDTYGSLEPAAALELLERLDPRAEHFDRLRTVLRQGHAHHSRSPDAWEAAGRA